MLVKSTIRQGGTGYTGSDGYTGSSAAITLGITAITGGSTGQLLYDNAGLLGESAITTTAAGVLTVAVSLAIVGQVLQLRMYRQYYPKLFIPIPMAIYLLHMVI